METALFFANCRKSTSFSIDFWCDIAYNSGIKVMMALPCRQSVPLAWIAK